MAGEEYAQGGGKGVGGGGEGKGKAEEEAEDAEDVVAAVDLTDETV